MTLSFGISRLTRGSAGSGRLLTITFTPAP